ncbi:MAG: flagellar biosynthesis protein FlhB [Rhodospirillales bacterium RIFCSPLOWO2_01_FULL_65_14]|nr:MAG: flagellar biosynthesis protein FlhB [Rhodospirillales bacterium RIFCSPLOWO2_01_FULL_65_14]
MAEEDDSQKTEEPSDKKLSRAKEKGQVAQSQEIKSWLILLGGAGILIALGPFMARSIRNVSLPFIESPQDIPMDFPHMHQLVADLSLDVGIILAPILGLLFVLAIFSNVAQFGLLFAPEKVQFDLSKLSLVGGVKRMVSSRALMEFLKGILKLVAVGAVSFSLALPLLADIRLIPFMEVGQSMDRIQLISVMLAVGTVGVMTLIAAADFAFQRYSFRKQMRMSKHEVKDEYKQSEGDPQIKARIRKLRMERAQQRMMAAVPKADVVITNPTHYAVALEYKMNEMPAPKVVAKGIDHLALRIRLVAEENDVPLVENPPLARALYASVELDQEIPPEHFKAVAEVIGYVLRLKGKLPGIQPTGVIRPPAR